MAMEWYSKWGTFLLSSSNVLQSLEINHYLLNCTVDWNMWVGNIYEHPAFSVYLKRVLQPFPSAWDVKKRVPGFLKFNIISIQKKLFAVSNSRFNQRFGNSEGNCSVYLPGWLADSTQSIDTSIISSLLLLHVIKPFFLLSFLSFSSEHERTSLQYSWNGLLFTGLANTHWRTHTHTKWKQIGWICSARRNARHMCLCVLGLDDRAEGMKREWEKGENK